MGNCKGVPEARAEPTKTKLPDGKGGGHSDTIDVEVLKQMEEPLLKGGNAAQFAATDVLQRVREEYLGQQMGVTEAKEASNLEWLNFAVEGLWEYVNDAVRKIFKEDIEQKIQAAVHKIAPLFSGIRFDEFDLGTKPPKLGPIKVSVSKDQFDGPPGIELCIDLDWNCDANISLFIPPGATIGIKALNIKGELLVILRPLMRSVPIVGGIQITMVSPPRISWNLTGLASITKFPTIASTLKGVVANALAEKLVLPNRIFIHWVWGREREVDISAMQYPLPQALLKIGVVRATGLKGMDMSLFGGQATSDPYAKIRVGDGEHITPVVKKNLNPEWGEDGWYDFLMYSAKQLVTVELYDSDLWIGASDDFLGELTRRPDGEHVEDVRPVRLCDLLAKPDAEWDIYFKSGPGKNPVPAGKIHIQVEAFCCSHDPAVLKKPVQPRGKATADGLLSVELRGLRGLEKRFATGATIKIVVTDEKGEKVAERQSINSVYREEVVDPNALDVDPTIQRMVEFLAFENHSHAQIMKVSGLSKEQVARILERRPSFHTKWNQSIHIPMPKPDKACVQLQLVVPADGKEKEVAPIQLKQPLSMHKDVVTRENMRLEEVVVLDRADGTRGVLDGPFELDFCVQVRGLSRLKLEEWSG